MIDVIARGMAAAAQGGAGESYTRAETDALLALKENLINSEHKVSSDNVDFNLTASDINALHDLVMSEKQTEVKVEGDNITILTSVTAEDDDIQFNTDSVFKYKDDINL